MLCSSCKTIIPPGLRFCGRCGAEVESEKASSLSPADSESSSDLSLASSPAPETWKPNRFRGSKSLSKPGTPELSEFPPVAQTGSYVLWGSRILALLIDVAMLGAVFVIITLVGEKFGLIVAPGPKATSPTGSASSYLSASFVVLAALYFSATSGSRAGQTIGYRAMGLSVRDRLTGNSIGYWKALARYLTRVVLYSPSIILLLVGYPQPIELVLLIPGVLNDIFPLWDPNRQTLADKLTRSIVIGRNRKV